MAAGNRRILGSWRKGRLLQKQNQRQEKSERTESILGASLLRRITLECGGALSRDSPHGIQKRSQPLSAVNWLPLVPPCEPSQPESKSLVKRSQFMRLRKQEKRLAVLSGGPPASSVNPRGQAEKTCQQTEEPLQQLGNHMSRTTSFKHEQTNRSEHDSQLPIQVSS